MTVAVASGGSGGGDGKMKDVHSVKMKYIFIKCSLRAFHVRARSRSSERMSVYCTHPFSIPFAFCFSTQTLITMENENAWHIHCHFNKWNKPNILRMLYMHSVHFACAVRARSFVSICILYCNAKLKSDLYTYIIRACEYEWYFVCTLYHFCTSWSSKSSNRACCLKHSN